MRERMAQAGFLAVLALLLVSGCATRQESSTATTSASTGETGEPTRRVSVRQDWGKTIYWVHPGRRVLHPDVFGTLEEPRFTLDEALEEAGDAPEYVRELMRELPTLVAAPREHRRRSSSDTSTVLYAEPTPYSDRATPLGYSREQNGFFRATIVDRVREDREEGLYESGDRVEFNAVFHDPAGNEYRVELTRLVELPLPGYETGNGAFLNRVHHGSTGTGSPLLPELYAHAGFWGMGRVSVNGKGRGTRLIHFMTTQVVRDRNYRLVQGARLPLGPERRHFPNQPHHSHLMVYPVKPVSTESGPPVLGGESTALRYAPVPTVFKGEDDARQRFIYVSFEQDTLEEVRGVELRFTS